MKRSISMFTFLSLVMSLLLSSTCSAQARTVAETRDLGNGVTVETVIVVDDDFLRSSTKRASISSTFKYYGEKAGTVTFTATFGYDGSRAWVVSASGSASMEPGWTYSGERISDSGGTAYLSASIQNEDSPGIIPVDISLTCSKDGDIS